MAREGTLRALLSGTFIGGVVNQCLSLGIRLDQKCDLGREKGGGGGEAVDERIIDGVSREGNSATCELNEFHGETLEVANQDLACKGIRLLGECVYVGVCAGGGNNPQPWS